MKQTNCNKTIEELKKGISGCIELGIVREAFIDEKSGKCRVYLTQEYIDELKKKI